MVAPAARADYVNPRFLGTHPWQPESVRSDESLVSLFGRPRALLRGTDKVREDTEVDPEGGRVIVRRRYGAVLVGPEWVQDLRGAVLAAGRTGTMNEWRRLVRREALKSGAAGTDVLSIELPVELPESIANVIGQGARLNLTGSERITFSGTSNIIKGGPQFESGNPSAFPDLDMKQQLRVNLDGTIGEKIHVLVNHDSEVDTDFENKIRLRYEGEEDEVIQKIEMGNTDLVLPGSEFLSFRKSQQGLFGAKAEAKLGALDMTVIASKQEGKTASQRFVGRSRRDSVQVKDLEYVKRKYYWAAAPERLAGDAGPPPVPTILPLEGFELFLDDKDTRNDLADGAKIGFAYTDPATGSPADSAGVHRGFYHHLDVNRDYTFDPQTGAITLERTLARDHALAAYYIYQGPGGPTEAGSLANPDTLELQLIAPPERELYDVAKGFAPLRDQELKNIYYLGAQNIRPESFEMRILRKASAAGEQDEEVQKSDQFENVEFLRILGLDYKGLTSPDPDLLVEPEFIDFEDGTITFPNPTPFAPDSSVFNVIGSAPSTGRTGEPGVPLLEYNEALYEQEPDDLFRNPEKYVLEVKYTTPTPTYALNQFNILEGSERVVLNGRLLSRGADYDIDYEFGVLTFRTPDASLPDAEIEVDFEYVPLFGQAKESLVGLSGTYHFGPRTTLSSSWLFFTRATPEERPKLGQEPSRILVGNMYGQWISNPNFMTGLVNSIPLVATEDESELQFQGEAALSLPNPNTKNQIYIDDMEGVEDSREFAITRGVWSPASEPVGYDTFPFVRPLPFNWYNPENVVRRADVFTELSTEREGQDFLQVLELGVQPIPAVDSTDPDSTGWMGIMRSLSTIGEDYSEKKFLEVWVNDFGARQGTMVVDLGEISEDFYVRDPADSTAEKGRGFLDTEDFNVYDGELTVSREDLGLDNVAGDDDLNVPGDDGDDDFEFRRSDPDSIKFRRINNYEGNSLLDTEDLDGDNFLDTDNAYLSYAVDLADQPVGGNLAIDNSLLVQGNTWRLFRIPLDDGLAVGGVPRLRTVKYARLWFDGLPPGPGRKVQVASVKIVGASWLEERISTNDTVEPVPVGTDRGNFRINVANNKEDSFYFSPFDAGEDVNNEERREQTLVMIYDEIPSRRYTGAVAPDDHVRVPGAEGYQGSAYKEILDTGQGQNQDFTQYGSLSFFLRDGALNPDGSLRLPESSSGTFFLRFGPDTTNYYEFSTTTLNAGADGNWREVFIDLQQLTEIKLDPPQKTVTVEGRQVEYRSLVVDSDTLAVYGAPTLARVRRITLGVKADDGTRRSVSGEIWVNELRLRSVKKDTGYATRATGRAKFADLMSVDGGVRKLDSEFRRIEGNRHGQNELSWNVRGDLKLNKFFDNRGISLPLAADYSYQETTPRLAPNSDIELLEEEDKELARSTTRRQSVSSRFSKTRPSKGALLRYTVDNLSVSGSTSTTRSRTPFLVSKDETITGQANYNLNPGQGKTFRLLRFNVSYFPTLQMGLTGRQNLRESADLRADSLGVRFEDPRAPVSTRALEANLGLQWDPLRSNTFDSQFSFNKRQDLDLHKDQGLVDSFQSGGRELQRDHKTRLSWRPGVLRWLRPVLSYDTDYREDQSPAVQSGDPNDPRLRRVENSNTREISTALSPRQIFKERREEPTPARRAGRRTGRATPPGQTQGEEGERDPAPATGQAEQPAEGEPPADGQEPEEEGDRGAAEGGAVEDEAAEDAAAPRRSLNDLWNGFNTFARMFGDIRYTYRDNRTSRFSRVGERPGFGYQFGVSDFDRGLVVDGPAGLIEDNTSVSYSSKFDTSFNPSQSFYLDTSYGRTVTRSARNSIRNKQLATTFPDLSVNLEGLERWRILSRWAKTSSLTGSFRRQTSRSGPLPALDDPAPPGENWYANEEVRRDFTPLFSWNTNWNSGINTVVSMNRTRNQDESEFNGTVSRTVTTTNDMRLTGRYSFSAPRGITFLGKRLRFKSDLTVSFDLSRGESKQQESRIQPNGDTTTTTRSHQKTMAVAPRATYNFSRKVQGSLDLGYNRVKNVQLDRTDTTIRVALEAVIKF
jgi:hypothetical protein